LSCAPVSGVLDMPLVGTAQISADGRCDAPLLEGAMLFVRCGNNGISDHPDETSSAADAELAARVLKDFLLHFKVPA
jgi:hypothetical protein